MALLAARPQLLDAVSSGTEGSGDSEDSDMALLAMMPQLLDAVSSEEEDEAEEARPSPV